MSEEPKWMNLLIKTAGKLGFSEVKMRWRLQKHFHKNTENSTESVQPVSRKFTKCYHCRALQSPGDKICDQCGKSIRPSLFESGQDFFTGWSDSLNTPTILMLLSVLAYLRIYLSQSGGTFMDLQGEALYTHGAIYGKAIVLGHQWWRLITMVLSTERPSYWVNNGGDALREFTYMEG